MIQIKKTLWTSYTKNKRGTIQFHILQNLTKFLGIKRSEEHTSELQSQFHLVCRLLLEKKKNKIKRKIPCRTRSLWCLIFCMRFTHARSVVGTTSRTTVYRMVWGIIRLRNHRQTIILRE